MFRRRLTDLDWRIFTVGVVAGFCDNSYFGWNWTPKSDAEIICDMIQMVILALAFLGGSGRRSG